MKKINNTNKKIIKKPKAPDYFNTYALNKWNELLPIFIEKYNLNTYDLSAFELLCLHYGDAMSIYNSIIKEYGSLATYFVNRNSQTMGEYLAYYKAITAYTKMLIEFGLTPASKKKIPQVEIVEEDDTLSKMINE